MNTELKNAVKATDKDAQYDTSAKRLLGQKSILAHILVKTVDEFKGMNPKDVVNCIEGTPHISTVPVEPGLTNAASEKNGERLVGFNTENEEINEGLVGYKPTDRISDTQGFDHFEAKFLYFPIPQAEVDANLNLEPYSPS